MRILLLLNLLLAAGTSFAQQAGNLTIVYDISINKTKKSSGLEETYNGGTKAVFIKGNKARIRQVSLMRMQSIFFEYDSTLKKATVIKESGAKKYRFNLTANEWNSFNKKYDSVTCSFENDSLQIAGYNCKKALIKLFTGEEIMVFYTDSIKPANNLIEPAFSCIPGIVLQYEYESKRGVITFKASQVSRDMIAKDIFTIPSAGYPLRKFTIAADIDQPSL